MKGSIFGEESNQFTNALGETITVELCDSPQQTTQLLSQYTLVLFGGWFVGGFFCLFVLFCFSVGCVCYNVTCVGSMNHFARQVFGNIIAHL